jgi:hypothetical protein
MSAPLRLVLFDATQMRRPPAALGWSWRVGAGLYGMLGRVDGTYGARGFADAFDWLERHEPTRSISELQFWGHGKWGRAFIDRETLDREALRKIHPWRARLERLRERLAPNPLIWFRTCETLGAVPGQEFASALGDFMGATVAGHTFVIGFFQSGLHALPPGARPAWSTSEGLARGTPARPEAALPSHPRAPNTVTCLTARLPPRVNQP